jgi:predicted component of type VI protein secretion system
MTTKTRDQLITAVLGKLQVLAAGQPQAPEDEARVSDNLDEIVEALNEQHITYVPNTDAIPGALFQDLAVMIAFALMGDFYVTQLAPGVDPARSQLALRTMLAGEPSRAILAADYF